MKRHLLRAALAACALVAAHAGCANSGGSNPGSKFKMMLTGLPASVATSTPQMVHLAVLNKDGTPATMYTGTVNFTATDAVAYLPASYTFTAADGGAHDFLVTLNTAGMQTLTTADAADGTLKADASANVAGAAYYYVPPTGGKIALIVDQANSSPTTAVLVLVAQTDLSGYFVGFDVAVDGKQLMPDASLITAGSALDPGNNPAAIAAGIPTAGPLANALVTGISQKASGNGAVATDAMIAKGTIFYTLKLPINPGAAGGTIMDGTVAKNVIRAGLRNKKGDEVVGVADFAIGKLVYTP